MPIDPNIALQVKPLQLNDPLAQYAQVSQIQSAQQANQLNNLKMQEYQRGLQEENQLRQLIKSGIDLNSPEAVNQMYAISPTKGLEFQTKQAAIKKASSEASKLENELVDQKLKQSRQFLDTIDPADPNAPARYIAWHEANHSDPVIGKALAARGVTAEQSRATIDAAIARGPEAFANLLNQSKLGTEKFIELNRPQNIQQTLGATTRIMQIPGLGGAATVVPGSEGTVTPTPSELQKNYGAAVSQGFKGTIFDYERAIKMAGRPPVQPVAPTITQVIDPKDPTRMLTVDARRYQPGTSFGAPGVIGVGGKEPSAALRENKVEVGRTQLKDDLDNLRESFKKLDTMTAIPSTERNALVNLGAGVSASAAGQKMGQMFGTPEQVERDVINSARMRLINAIKNATGMSAQQLNSNVELQTMLKSISDPSQSYQSAIRIIDDIENAYVNGKGMKKLPGGKEASSAATPSAAPAAPNIDKLLEKYK